MTDNSIFLLLDQKLSAERRRLSGYQDKLVELEKVLGDLRLEFDEWAIKIQAGENEGDATSISIRRRVSKSTPNWLREKITDRLLPHMKPLGEVEGLTLLAWGDSWTVSFCW